MWSGTSKAGGGGGGWGRKPRDPGRPPARRTTRKAVDPDALATCPPPPPRRRNQAEEGEQEKANGSPEGASAAEGAGRPRTGGHSPQAGAVHSGHGTWAGAAGWPRDRSGAGETRKAGKEGARRRERERRLGRRRLKRRRAGEGAGPSRAGATLSPPGAPAPGQPSHSPTSCILAPKPLSPIGGLGPLLGCLLPEAPPHRYASPPAHDVTLRTLAPGRRDWEALGDKQAKNKERGQGQEPTGRWKSRSRGLGIAFPLLPGAWVL